MLWLPNFKYQIGYQMHWSGTMRIEHVFMVPQQCM